MHNPHAQHEQEESSAGSAREDEVTTNDLFSKKFSGLSAIQAQYLASSVFGIDGQASILTSERDQNFKISTDQGRDFVLKATHPSEDPGVTDFQTRAQLHIMNNGPDVPVPRLRLTLDGEYVYRRNIPGSEQSQAIRIIDFISGSPLSRVQRSNRLLESIGAALAHLNIALKGFNHPQMNHKLLWDIQHLKELSALTGYIDDNEKRERVSGGLKRYGAETEPALKQLPKQVIHNDMNPFNIMVDDESATRLTAILDLGDMVSAPRVQDLAVLCAYLLSEDDNVLSHAVECIKAYHAVSPLTRSEIHLLPNLIEARLLATVLITEWRAREHPENSEYILRNNPSAWTGLQRLEAFGLGPAQTFIVEKIREAGRVV
ncbi:phosphotransferase [Pseudomonas mucidolens]|uniref:phosphotransferase n=1 Tax=Pseudomonas mucidolens TaxID=46679 RepID=UPI0030DD97E3